MRPSSGSPPPEEEVRPGLRGTVYRGWYSAAARRPQWGTPAREHLRFPEQKHSLPGAALRPLLPISGVGGGISPGERWWVGLGDRRGLDGGRSNGNDDSSYHSWSHHPGRTHRRRLALNPRSHPFTKAGPEGPAAARKPPAPGQEVNLRLLRRLRGLLSALLCAAAPGSKG